MHSAADRTTAFEYCVLGSGSRGNATIVRWREQSTRSDRESTRSRCLLIDAGLSPRETTRRLHHIGLSIDDVEAVLLTHLDADHLHRGWCKVLVDRNITLHLHERHRYRAKANGVPKARISLFNEQPFSVLPGVKVRPKLLAHDDEGVVAFRISEDHRSAPGVPTELKPLSRSLGFATDLGRITDSFIDFLLGVDSLAIESNYDRNLQLTSTRPLMLKRRIMGGRGHLSNDESLEAVLAIRAQRELGSITLLHLSQQCNDPKIIQHLYEQRAPELVDRLTITSQHAPSPWQAVHASPRDTAPTPGVQLRMF